jgi:hypothetical protein
VPAPLVGLPSEPNLVCFEMLPIAGVNPQTKAHVF